MKHLFSIFILCLGIYKVEGQVVLDTAAIRQNLRAAQASFGQYAYPEALASANKALELFGEAPDTLIQLRAAVYRIKGGIYARMRQSEDARTNLLKAADIYQQLEPLAHQFLAQVYSNIGISYIQSSPVDFVSAIDWFRKAAETIQVSEIPNKGLIAMDYIGNIGMAHFYLNQFKQAEETYLEALNFIEEVDENNGDYIGMMEFRLGLLYEKKGNLAEALHQYQQALQNYQLKVKEDPLIGNIYRSMGLIHHKRGDYEKALLYAEKARLLFAKLIGPATEEYLSALDVQSMALTELGRARLAQKSDSTKGALLKQIYKIKGPIIASHEAFMAIKQAKQQKDPNIAVERLTEVLADFQQMSEPVEEEIAQFTLELGLAYLKLQQYQQAEQQFKESLKLHETLYESDAGEMVQPLFSLASLYTEQADFEKALPYFEKAVKANRLSKPINIHQLADPLIAIEIMSKKAQLYADRYEKTHNSTDWQTADSLLNLSLDLVEMIQASAATENSKIGLQDKVTSTLETNLGLLWSLQENDPSQFDLQEVFNWMERGKNFVLLQSIIRSNARKYANIPDSFLQKEKRLLEDIAFYEKEIFLLQQKEGSQELEKEWTDLLLELKKSNAQLQGLLQEAYPDYYNLKNQKPGTLSIDQIKKR
ncbi:MAG: tetratricopeptide repeat protein, partial [Bacteroidota bacterium]